MDFRSEIPCRNQAARHGGSLSADLHAIPIARLIQQHELCGHFPDCVSFRLKLCLPCKPRSEEPAERRVAVKQRIIQIPCNGGNITLIVHGALIRTLLPQALQQEKNYDQRTCQGMARLPSATL